VAFSLSSLTCPVSQTIYYVFALRSVPLLAACCGGRFGSAALFLSLTCPVFQTVFYMFALRSVPLLAACCGGRFGSATVFVIDVSGVSNSILLVHSQVGASVGGLLWRPFWQCDSFCY